MNYGIALGSNLGDRLGHLRHAVRLLLELGANTRLLASAPIYETAPVDCPDGSQSFYNTVIEVEANMEPLALLKELHSIEALLGRPLTHECNAPRTVDMDLLYADSLIMQHAELTLPHPRMTQRRFVLQPLADIRPDLVIAGETRSVSQLLADLMSDEPMLKQVSSALPN